MRTAKVINLKELYAEVSRIYGKKSAICEIIERKQTLLVLLVPPASKACMHHEHLV